jgi:thiamine biosynthesis lipoprotein
MLKRISFLVGLWVILLSACAPADPYFQDNGIVFNTSYQIKYQAPKNLTEKIDAKLQQFNLSLNPFNPNSIISKVNRNEPVEVDEWFTTVFNKAQEVSRNTDGMFDITAAPLINIWGFGFEKMDEITPEAIDSLKQFVGYQKIRLEGNKVVKDDDRLTLNASALAKGFACDVIAQLLEEEGVTNYMVEIGGEVTLSGVNPNGECWRVGIRKPELEDTNRTVTIEEVVQLCKKGGIATSGDYQNFYVKDGKKYAHTINPATGYPAEQNILSSTIVADDCITADAYATAFTAMGLEEAVRVADSIEGLEYFFIYTENSETYKFKYSKGIIQYLPERQALAILENP